MCGDFRGVGRRGVVYGRWLKFLGFRVFRKFRELCTVVPESWSGRYTFVDSADMDLTWTGGCLSGIWTRDLIVLLAPCVSMREMINIVPDEAG